MYITKEWHAEGCDMNVKRSPTCPVLRCKMHVKSTPSPKLGMKQFRVWVMKQLSKLGSCPKMRRKRMETTLCALCPQQATQREALAAILFRSFVAWWDCRPEKVKYKVPRFQA
jgi:hypothetical protein